MLRAGAREAVPAGSFPRTPHALATDGFWSPETGRYGLFDVWSFSGLTRWWPRGWAAGR